MLTPNVNQDTSLFPCRGRLEYIAHEYSFSFDYQEAGLEHHRAWLCFGPIELAVSCLNGQLLGPSGYIGRRIWIDSSLSPIGPTQSSALVFEGFDQCQVGSGHTVEGEGLEKLKFNPTSGWAHVGNGYAAFDSLVEFATNCRAAIRGHRIIALWLHPENWRELA